MYITSIYNNNILINLVELYNSVSSTNTLENFLKNKLNKDLSNKCNSDGLIIKNSIKIIKRNIGQFNLNHNILYNITYTADILYPNEGCIINLCKIIYISDILYIGFVREYNLIIIIPVKFINDDDINNIKKNNYISIICLDKYYEINDEYMFVIGTIYNKQYYDKLTIDNDNVCKDIIKEVTDFKEDYYELFNKKIKETMNEMNIKYNTYEYTENKLNSILETLKNNIINYIEQNKDNIYLQTIDKNTILNITDEKTLLTIFDSILLYMKKDAQLYTEYKKNLYSNFNEDTYKVNKINSEKLYKLNTNNSNTIINNGNYCYIISVLQMLKNCKLFIKDLIYYNIPEDKIDIINELKSILIDNKNTLTDFVNLLETYINENNIDLNIHTMNDINDFIYILFNIIDNNISSHIYIKNNYDYINEKEYSNIDKTNNTETIHSIISNLKTINNTSILKYFYNIHISEFNCATCNYKYFHILNKLIHNIYIDDINNNTINDCINTTYNNDEYIEGFECPICKNKSITQKLYFELDSINYFMCSLNRWIFNNDILIKNDKDIIINNRLSLNIINSELSVNTVIFKNTILDLKTTICHIGSINSGHYITINKDKNDVFYIYDDNYKSKITNYDFFNNSAFKHQSYTLIYQNNIIYDLPLSNLSLLEYEDNILNEYNDSITKYISENINVGIHMGKLIGGYKLGDYNIDSVPNIKKLINATNSNILFVNDIIDAFKKLLSNDPLLKEFNKCNFILDDDNITLDLLGEFIHDYENKLLKYDPYFYIEIIKQNITKFNEQITILEQNDTLNQFLEPCVLLNNKNIYIGSTGYNTPNTNHWDIIYSRKDNNLDLYKKHFNTIEINHTYYNDYNNEHWIDIFNKIEEASINPTELVFSIIFNKEICDLFLTPDIFNNPNSSDISIKLQKQILDIFSKYWDDKISVLNTYIHNILFKFNSDFYYTPENFTNLQSFLILKDKLEPLNINIVFEFYDEIWYQNTEVINFFKSNGLSMTTLICNNNNKIFGDKLQSNYVSDNYSLKYLNNIYKVNYIKLYGSIHKYYGSHINDIPIITKYIKSSANYDLFDKITSGQDTKSQYIYFNNIEGSYKNHKYSEYPDNTQIPSAIYDGRMLYKLLDLYNKF